MSIRILYFNIFLSIFYLIISFSLFEITISSFITTLMMSAIIVFCGYVLDPKSSCLDKHH